MCRSVLWPTQSPFQCITRASSQGPNRQKEEGGPLDLAKVHSCSKPVFYGHKAQPIEISCILSPQCCPGDKLVDTDKVRTVVVRK